MVITVAEGHADVHSHGRRHASFALDHYLHLLPPGGAEVVSVDPSLHLNNRRRLALLRELRPDRLEHVVLDRLRSRLLSLRLHHLIWHGPTSGSELREIGWDERRQPLGPIVKHHNHRPSLI